MVKNTQGSRIFLPALAASSNWYSRSAPACADGSSDNNLLTDSVESCAAVNPCNETEKKKIYKLGFFWIYD